MCSDAAFIDRPAFTLPVPPQDDKGFELWQADLAAKYPALLKSYDLLRNCWDTYHKNTSPRS